MQKLFLSLLITLFAFSFFMTEAQAKRFGGGRSFGQSRDTSSFSRFNSNSNASRAQPMATPPSSTASRWLGPLAGLAVGGLLGSLFMSHGLGSGIMSWLLIGGLIFLAWGFFRSRMQQPQPAVQTMQNTAFSPTPAASYQPTAGTGQHVASFEEAQFLRDAKVLFIRLQAAYDSKNLQDIREFTAPEIFAEIQLQLQERGNEPNHTEVINIDAELLDITSELASARFSGLICEDIGWTPTAIREIWHFQKNNPRSNWVVTGIQQE